MKFTNVKQLIIKFMGGGLINFPTRFLRWVKINGDTEGSDDGGGDSGGGEEGNSNIFFSPLAIQPTHIGVFIDDTFSIVEIKDVTLNADGDLGGPLIYSKEDLISVGINENDLNNLEIVSVDEIEEDSSGSKGLSGNYINNILDENYIVSHLSGEYEDCSMQRIIKDDNEIPVIYRFGDNLYAFGTIQGVS